MSMRAGKGAGLYSVYRQDGRWFGSVMEPGAKESKLFYQGDSYVNAMRAAETFYTFKGQ